MWFVLCALFRLTSETLWISWKDCSWSRDAQQKELCWDLTTGQWEYIWTFFTLAPGTYFHSLWCFFSVVTPAQSISLLFFFTQAFIQNTLWDFLLTSLVQNTKRTRFSELFKLTVDCWQQRNNPARIKFTLSIHLLAFWSLHSRSMHRCHLPCGCWGHVPITLLETFDKRKIAWTQKKLTNKWEPLTHKRCFIQSM